MTQGILLVNLGTPISPAERDVKRYLTEFLTDERVIDLPYLKRHLLVKGIIVPKRYRTSAKLYQSIWTEEGSPLLVYGRRVEASLQEQLGPEYKVRLAMRYQEPSMKTSLEDLRGVKNLVVFPLFPQYASATTGSVYQKVFDILSQWEVIPSLRMISNYADHPALIEAFVAVSQTYALETYDHIVFSYHGLPQRHLKKADRTGQCLKDPDCCKKNPACYKAQCTMTTQEIVKSLKLPSDRWSQCFQSRLGKDPWIQPYTSCVLKQLLKEGKKRVLVFCPAFVCDCLETLEEIGSEYRSQFLKGGGECLDLVEGLNDHPKWIDAIEAIIKNAPPC